MSNAQPSCLDNPVWHALKTQHAHLAQGSKAALRYPSSVSPFAAVESPQGDAFAELSRLLLPDETSLLLSTKSLTGSDGLQLEPLFKVRQMVDQSTPASASTDGVIRLGAGDAQEMLALANQTKPGPFGLRTLEMGNYIGLRDAGRLVAMAGERLRMEGYVEISAVCVDDAYRGRGLASRLMNILRKEIRTRGEVPFLHVRDDSAATIGLYERMGFVTRETFLVHQVTRR